MTVMIPILFPSLIIYLSYNLKTLSILRDSNIQYKQKKRLMVLKMIIVTRSWNIRDIKGINNIEHMIKAFENINNVMLNDSNPSLKSL